MLTREERCGKKILHYRKEIGYTQKMFADVMGISVPTLRKYEKGEKVPDSEFIARFATFFNASPEIILRIFGELSEEGRKEMFSEGEEVEPKEKKSILKQSKYIL